MRRYLKLLRYALPYRGRFSVIFVLTVLASGLAALQPWPIKLILDNVLEKKPLPQGLATLMGQLNMDPGGLLRACIGGGLLLFLISSCLDAWITLAWTTTGGRLVNDLSCGLFARLQRRSLLFHSRNEVGDSISRVMGDSWCVHQMLDTVCFAPLHALLTMTGMIILMELLEPTLTLLALVVVPLMVGASFLFGKRMRALARRKRELETSIQSHLQQTLSGIPIMQAFAQEDREHRQFQQLATDVIAAQKQSTFLSSLGGLSSGIVTALGTGAIIWEGARLVGMGRLTIGGLVVFLAYLTSLQAQTRVLAGLYPAWQNLRASMDRLLEILDAEPEIPEKPGAPALAHGKGRVQIENVTFGYQTGQPVLRDVSLEVLPGRVLAIVGATGAGKSTLAGLVPRFIDPWQGRVMIDGQDVRDLKLNSVRAQVAMVLQEPFLQPFSIAENIAYGRPEATRAEIEEAARLANAHQFIERLPQGYDTAVGEHGATLSGGERQRLAIARALLKNAPILILDEPTSALDVTTESLIFEALERLMAGRTTIIIAHRLSTVQRADQIIVLERGAICETGTHDELIVHGGRYAHLHKLQFQPRAQPVVAAASA